MLKYYHRMHLPDWTNMVPETKINVYKKLANYNYAAKLTGDI
jgi:cbb3-type cytochrome oxidase cytochrome c subunit